MRQTPNAESSVELSTAGISPTTSSRVPCRLDGIQRLHKRRHSYPPSTTKTAGTQKQTFDPNAPDSIWNTLYEELLPSTSTVEFILSLVVFFVTDVLVKYMRSNYTSIRLWPSLARTYTLVVPVMLVLCNEEVMTYAKTSLFPRIAQKFLRFLGLANREPAKPKEH